MHFRITFLFCLSSLYLISFFAHATPKCEEAFGSRLYYDRQAIKRMRTEETAKAHPEFVDIAHERTLQKYWNKEPDNIPKLLDFLLPKGVHYINSQLYQPGSATAVKIGEWGNEIIARAHYKHKDRMFHTNVAFSVRALLDNLNDGGKNNWLVGKRAKAAILFLHGGGSKSTGFHVAGNIITHLSQYGIDVVSLDLGWHAQGHREFLDAKTDIEVLGSFVQKYIPPQVPLFVVGHSWGSVFAEQIMRMSDRPPSEFFFHNNLKGAVILSTAVDAAPGKSKSEKYEAYFKRLKEAKKRAETEAPKGELNIFTNIIRDGKTSPIGGAYSMHFISQLDQTAPAHRGNNYIPALMVVGTKDPLVYFGFEDLYDVYRNLTNVSAHYLDKPMPHKPYGEIHGVGHDVFSTLDPKTRESIVYTLVKNFISQQLIMDSLKAAIIKEVQSNPTYVESSSQSQIIDAIHSLKSLKALTQFLDNNKSIQQEISSELLQHIDNAASGNLVTKSLLKKQKPNIPSFIRLMQLTANELSFREFLSDFVYHREKKTATYISYSQKKIIEKTQVLAETIQNYSTTPQRIQYLLEQIIHLRGMSDVSGTFKELNGLTKDILTQIDWIISNSSSSKGSLSLNNVKLKTDLIELRTEIENLKDPVNFPNKKLGDIKKKAKQILEEHSNFFSISKRSSKKISVLTRAFLNSKDLEEVKEIIRLYGFPPHITKKIIGLMTDYFTIKSILNIEYVPSPQLFKRINMTTSKHKARALDIIIQLSIVVTNIKERNKEYLEAIENRSRLKSQYDQLLSNVRQNIAKIKNLFKKTDVMLPPYLTKAHEKSLQDLKEVVKAAEEMDKALDKVFREGSQLQEFQVATMLEENKPAIKHFENLYRQYIQNRSILRRDWVLAGERGELGKEIQTIIVSLYGYGTNGINSVPSTDNKFSALRNTVSDLADAEAKVNQLEHLRRESQMEYNDLMNTLRRLTVDNKQLSKKDLQLIQDASNLFNFVEYPLIGILNGTHGNIQLNGSSNKSEIAQYIESYNRVFLKTIEHWNKLSSKYLPLLPTDSVKPLLPTDSD